MASNGGRLEVVAGAAEVGFGAVRLNGQSLVHKAVGEWGPVSGQAEG